MIHMSVEEYRALTGEKPSRKGYRKHRNRPVYVYADGFFCNEKLKDSPHGDIVERYDSEKEFMRASELRILEKSGRISNLRKQVPFLLHPAFTDKGGKAHRAVYYKADFVYEQDGNEVVEDVKAFSVTQQRYLTTETFNLKWKMLQAQNPDKVFRLF